MIFRSFLREFPVKACTNHNPNMLPSQILENTAETLLEAGLTPNATLHMKLA